MMSPLSVAVIMPALNAAGWIREALASLTDQAADFEVVLVDGGSRDETMAIAAAQPNLRVVSAPGTSIYEALNRGIAETRALAIVFLNADDTLLPGAIEAWRDALARAPECGIARGRATFVEVDRGGSLVPISRISSRVAGPLTADLLLRGPCAINSLCIRRSVFDRIGSFDTKYRLAADRDWMLRAFTVGVGVAEIDRPVYRYLSHAGSSTLDRLRRNYALMRCEHLDIATRNLAEASPGKPLLTRALRRWHAAETAMLAWHQVRALDLSGAASTLARATRLDASWPAALAGESARWLAQRRSE
jgi:glycosyltransferase involved in cell wall biosynthesis